MAACLDSDTLVALAFVEDGAIACEQGDVVFQAASVSKCVTACTIARLAEQGQLDLEDPLERYLGRGSFPESITVRRVLSHTAGLSQPDFPGIEPGLALPAPRVRAVEPAGRGFRYSGGGYALLALAIEKITGERFAEHVARSVLEPLGMRRSSFDQNSPLIDDAATGHDREGRALPFYRFEGAAAAGLFTTAADLARFALAHFPGHGLLARPTLRTLTTPVVSTGRADGLWAHYGLGYEVESLAGGRVLVGHHGVNRGWRALLAIEIAAGRALVALANSDAAMPALDAALAEWIA